MPARTKIIECKHFCNKTHWLLSIICIY